MCRSPFLDLILFLKPRGLEAFLELVSPPAIQEYFAFLEASVKRRIALQEEREGKPEEDQRQDIFHFLYTAIDPETGLRAYDDNDLMGEVGMLVVAGSDTTSVSLSAIYFYLTGDPRRLKKVEDEILGTFHSADEIIHGPRLASCTYLRACVDEAMRISPAAAAELPREVLPGGIYIKGQYFPEGTVVGASSWCDFRNQEVFGDPELFRPERWIVNEPEGITKEDVARARANFHPFSAGSGNCVGKVFAISEIMIAVARTLHRLEIRRTPGSTLGAGNPSLGWGMRSRAQMQLREAYISLRDGPEVQYRKRTVHP